MFPAAAEFISVCGADGKRRHTRPRCSGHQLFVLEERFEKTKYIDRPERLRLAYSLGMREKQVKCWFHNRRAKWRRQHAAEMGGKKTHDGDQEADGSRTVGQIVDVNERDSPLSPSPDDDGF